MAVARPKTTVRLRATGQGRGHSRTDISVRDLAFTIDEPVERGGTNAGPTPTDTALAALIGCTNVIGHKCAAALGVDIGDLAIEAICDFDRRGVTLSEGIALPFRKVTLDVTASGSASQEELDRVAAEVARFCPVSRLFREAGTVIEETWSKG